MLPLPLRDRDRLRQHDDGPDPDAEDLSTDISDCGTVTAGSDWGVFSCTDGPLSGYCVATPTTCDKVYIYKYSKSLSDYPSCANADYLNSGVIVPGDEAGLSLFASIPKGMPAGQTKTGILTIFAGY